MDDQRLSSEFLRTSFYSKEKVGFSPWLTLYTFPLLREIAERLSEKIESQIDASGLTGICALARSGIPLGILLSLRLNKPLHFYFRDAKQFEDRPGRSYHLFPQIEKGGNYLLVDSHAVTLFTASSAAEYIESEGAHFAGLAVVFSFSDGFISNREVASRMRRVSPVVAIGSMSEHHALIADIVGYDNGSNLPDALYFILKQQSPSQQEYYPDSPFVPTHFHRIWDLALGLIKFAQGKGRPFRPRTIDSGFAHELRDLFGSSESEIWSLLSHPFVMQKIGKLIESSIQSENIDAIFAVGLLGTVLALIAAYSGSFKGSIFTTYKPILWDEFIREREINQAIITTGRLRTGMFIRGTYNRLSDRYAIHPSKIIVLRYAHSNIFPLKHLFSYNYLQGLEDIVYVLS